MTPKALNEFQGRILDEDIPARKAKFAVYGREMIDKTVRSSGASGRIYLPLEWIGKTVKIIRID